MLKMVRRLINIGFERIFMHFQKMTSTKESAKRVQLDPKEKAIFWKIIKDSQGGKVWK